MAKYRLPPNDERFEGRTLGDLLSEARADWLDQREDEQRRNREARGAYLGDAAVPGSPEAVELPYDRPHLTGDPWADEIELAIARGEEPRI